MRSNKILLSCGIVIIIVLVLAIFSLLLFSLRIPDVSTQIKNLAPPIFVVINMPQNNSEATVGQGMSVYVEAHAKNPIKDIELFVDGVLIHNRLAENPAEPGKPRVIRYGWVPTETGRHQLVARAYIDTGQTSLSNVVNIDVIPQVQPPLVELNGEPSENPMSEEEIQALIGDKVDLKEIEKLADEAVEDSFPPGIEPEELAPGPPVFEEEGSDSPPQGIIPVEYVVWGGQLVNWIIPVSLPAAPEIQGEVKDCRVILKIRDNADNEAGHFLYRLDPGSNLFTRIATLQDIGGKGQVVKFTDQTPPVGELTYYASSFNSAGEVQGNMLGLKVENPPCKSDSPPAWTPQEAVLKTSTGVEKIYGYISVNKEAWYRIPFSSDSFIFPQNGQFDITKYLPSLEGTSPTVQTIDLDLWGWSGKTLIPLGKAFWEVKPGLNSISGEKYTITVNITEELEISDTISSIQGKHIPAPDKLRFFASEEECLQNIKEGDNEGLCWLMKQSYSVVTWRWLPNEIDEITEIDGFHMYQVLPGEEPELIRTYPADDRTALIAPPSADPDESPPQIFLRAFKGKEESANSNMLNGKTISGVRITNSLIRVDTGFNIYRVFATPHWSKHKYYLFGEWSAGPGSIQSMTLRLTRFVLGKKYISMYLDSFIAFDPSSIKGQVQSAKLRWTDGSVFMVNYPENFKYWKCQVNITDGSQGSILHAAPLSPGTFYDVTWLVRNWQMGLPVDYLLGFQTADNSLSFKTDEGIEMCNFGINDLYLEVVTADQ